MGGLLRYSFTLRQCSSSLSVFGSCKRIALGMSHNGDILIQDLCLPTNLHPEEESFWSCLELQYIHTACGALWDSLELTVIRKNNQILENVSGETNVWENTSIFLLISQILLPSSTNFLPSAPQSREDVGVQVCQWHSHPNLSWRSSFRSASRSEHDTTPQHCNTSSYSHPPHCPKSCPSSRSEWGNHRFAGCKQGLFSCLELQCCLSGTSSLPEIPPGICSRSHESLAPGLEIMHLKTSWKEREQQVWWETFPYPSSLPSIKCQPLPGGFTKAICPAACRIPGQFNWAKAEPWMKTEGSTVLH